MSNDIEIIIKSLLKEVGRVHVPGLGTFSRNMESAYIAPDRYHIHPPKFNVAFDPSPSSDDSLLTYVAKGFDVSDQAASNRVSEYVNRVTQSLLLTGQSKIYGIGELERKGNNIVFTDTYNIVTKPTLSISPIQTIKKVEQSPMPVKDNSSGAPWYLWLILLGLAALAILSWRSCYGGVSDASEVHSSETTVLTSSMDSNSHLHEVEDADIDNEGIIHNNYGQAIPQSKNCIIITGSLKRPSNVVRMEAQLMAKGYEVHKSEYNGLTRVGITFECMDVDLVEYVQEIRQSINAKAWYLDPEMEVAYKQ